MKSKVLCKKAMMGLLLLAVLAPACKEKDLVPVETIIEDPHRHYYPVIQGQTLPVIYEIENVGKEPLVIQEVQTSCGCLIPQDDLPIVVLPEKTGRVRLGYNSIKNTGYVQHQVYVYGNFTDSLYRLLTFDTHIVPPADYTRDYEDLWHEQTEKGDRTLRDLVDGDSNTKGYYTDEGTDPRDKTRKDRQRKADEILDF